MDPQKMNGLEYLNRAAEELCREPSDEHDRKKQRDRVSLQLALAATYLLASIAEDLDTLRRRMAP